MEVLLLSNARKNHADALLKLVAESEQEKRRPIFVNDKEEFEGEHLLRSRHDREIDPILLMRQSSRKEAAGTTVQDNSD